MSEVEELAGSVLCVGFSGASAAEAPLAELAELGPAALLLFARNVRTPETTRELVDAARAAVGAAHGVAPFVAVDQEGGRVARLRAGAHEIPSAMALGAAGDEALAERVARLVASDLRRTGIDVNFAPVLDLALAPEAVAIGTRAFGDDPERVGRLGVAFGRGLERGGVTATYKHFPGHGAAIADSHVALPVLDVNETLLRRRELVPFAHAIANGARAIMSAHVVVTALDSHAPATLSRRVITGLLREELGFGGAIFSDCLEMAAIANGPGIAQGAVDALSAGVDGVLISHHLEAARAARDAIVRALTAKTLSESQLRAAAARLRALPRTGAVAGAVDADAAREAARRAITFVRVEAGTLPLDVGRPLTVVSFESETVEGAQGKHSEFASLSHALRERGVRSEMLRVPLEPSPEMIESLVALARTQHGRQFALVARRALVHPGQRAAIAALLAEAVRAILVCAREPFDAALFERAQTVVCSFGDEEIAIAALADVLCGRTPATGSLPVRLDRAR